MSLFVAQVPELSNQVLLRELLFDDNSIMSLSSLQNAWLPSLVNLSVAHNRLSVVRLYLLFGWKLGFCQILDSLYEAI